MDDAEVRRGMIKIATGRGEPGVLNVALEDDEEQGVRRMHIDLPDTGTSLALVFSLNPSYADAMLTFQLLDNLLPIVTRVLASIDEEEQHG